MGRALATELAEVTDGWLRDVLAGAVGDRPADVALLAVGGYGRGELAPGSDLDLVLVHRSRRDITAVAKAVWYPIWDTGIRLDHSTRTPRELGAAMDADLRVAVGLLDARTVAGSDALGAEIRQAIAGKWVARAARWLPALRASVAERHRTEGDLAFLLEPDLKEGRGGLRDAHLLRALGVAGDRLEGPIEVLTDTRVELQRHRACRPGDRLRLEDQDAVAAALGADADTLMARLAAAGRTVAWAGDDAWGRLAGGRLVARAGDDGRVRLADTRRRGAWFAEPIEPGLVARGGAVTFAYGADPTADPTLSLRAAAASVELGLPLAPETVDALSSATPSPPTPWPPELLHAFLRLLGAGGDAIPLWETLDHQGVLGQLLPQWAGVRHRPQRNAFHRFTVDRHLLETVAHAARHARRVERPDLLLLGAMFHDIGKAVPGDHTAAGVAIVQATASRIGLVPEDASILRDLVRHHLLLPEVATRRDLDDPATIEAVATAAGDRDRLHLLAALWDADAHATGPAAWSPWKAGLVATLVERADQLLEGHPPPEPPPLSPAELRLLAGGETTVALDGTELTVVAPSSVGLLATVAGAVAAAGASIRSAVVRGSDGPIALLAFRVENLAGTDIVEAAVRGELDVDAAVADRERCRPARRPDSAHHVDQVVVRVDHDASARSTLLEVRAPDRPGTLWRIATALAGAGAAVTTAVIATLGAEVVDTFYLARPAPPDEALRRAVAVALGAADPSGAQFTRW